MVRGTHCPLHTRFQEAGDSSKLSAKQEGSRFYRQCVLWLCHIWHTLSKANRGRGEVLRGQTGLGLYANSHHGSKGGSQAESKSGCKVDLKGCGI